MKTMKLQGDNIMNITSKMELLENLFNCELSYSGVPDLDFGKITVRYGDKPVPVKRYHTNILQRIVNRIFGTAYQTVKTTVTWLVVVTMTTPENRQYTVCFDEDILDNAKNGELMDEIVKPQIFRLKRAAMKDLVKEV